MVFVKSLSQSRILYLYGPCIGPVEICRLISGLLNSSKNSEKSENEKKKKKIYRLLLGCFTYKSNNKMEYKDCRKEFQL